MQEVSMIRSSLLGAGVILFVSTGCKSSKESSPLELALSSPGVTGQAPPLPFHGRIDGQLTFVPPFQPGSLADCNANFSGDPAHPGPSVSGFDQADGVFSMIGRIELQSVFCFDPDSPESEGTATLTAMNGERIFVGFANTAGVPDAHGNIPVNGTQWITGGTGRFTGASGDQVCQFTVNATTLRIQGSCRGEIRFEPSAGAARE
jgi:hypothetical protein